MLAFIVVPPLASASPRASPACDLGARAFRDPHISFATLTTHGHRVERRRRRQQHARADGFGRGGAATAWAAAALSARARRLRSAVRCTGKRGGAGTRGGGGEQASGPRAARRTGDRQAGDGPESDRAQRSETSRRRSAAADLEGVRSATVGVGGRPSCGEEGGRQVRVVRVALHRPVERHSSRDRSKACRV